MRLEEINAFVVIRDESELGELCRALIDSPAPQSDGWGLSHDMSLSPRADTLHALRYLILHGHDPLGDAFCRLRSKHARRKAGAVYTPAVIVSSIVEWVARSGTPGRVVDPGCGSGRFLAAAGRAFPAARLVGVDADPMAVLMCRANMKVLGFENRSEIVLADYRDVVLPDFCSQTTFIGNPPYVRHHDIEPQRKSWYTKTFDGLGIKASGLAGLHTHFILKTHLLAKAGDSASFVTSAEWLDANYGAAVREAFLGAFGCESLHVLAPEVEAFPGTATTAAIICFKPHQTLDDVRFDISSSLSDFSALGAGTPVSKEDLQGNHRWTAFSRPIQSVPDGMIELGEIFSVHRGQVTGSNETWIAESGQATIPDRFLFPTVTKAKDLITAGAELLDPSQLRRVIDLPTSLDDLPREEKEQIGLFLQCAKERGIDAGYVASHRRAWWSVGLRDPAPILCTYMARRPPQFTLNTAGARHINIAHGLYPRVQIGDADLRRIVAWLNENVTTNAGRMYAGGLAKFEPREIERIKIPALSTFQK